MSWLASFALYVFHAIYHVANFISSIRRHFTNAPRPLDAQRKQVPSHLALVLASDEKESTEGLEECMLDNVEEVVSWCRTAGIRKLTVYDRKGVLSSLSLDIRKRLVAPMDGPSGCANVESEIEYPLTPPLSDDAESRPVSPDENTQYRAVVTTINLTENLQAGKRRRASGRNGVKRRRSQHKESAPRVQPLTLYLVSRKSGKPSLAGVANRYLHQGQLSSTKGPIRLPEISIRDITEQLEGEHGLPPPDLMIVHDVFPSYPRPSLELHGFPPWQVRLTELYHSQSWTPSWLKSSQRNTSAIPTPLNELEFRRALDVYNSAEMRLGK